MKNSDMPAMPTAATENGYGCNYDKDLNGQVATGLTKREMFAMHIGAAYLSGQLSWTNGVDGGVTPSHKEVAEEVVSFADALLAELEGDK